MQIKVFFVSDRVNWYLPPALDQAAQLLGADKVVFICDAPHRFAGETLLASTLDSTRVDEFARVYEHLSSNPEGFEFACFRRWFLIAAACDRLGCDVAVHLDTDVGLGAGVDAAFLERLAQHDFGACSVGDESSCVSPHVSVFHREALAAFCDFLIASYRDPEQLDELRRLQAEGGLGVGGVCDMILMGRFAQARPMANLLDGDGAAIDENFNRGLNRAGEPPYVTNDWGFNGAAIDENFNRGLNRAGEPPYVTNDWGFKKIRRADGRFFGRRVDGVEREFALLHFQGFAKLLLPAMLGRPGAYFRTSKRMLLRWAWHVWLQRRRVARGG
jgi:hypothetical protein